MAFLIKNFSPVGANAKKGSSPQVFSYKSSDTIETIIHSGYFNEVKDLLVSGDIIIIHGNNDTIIVNVVSTNDPVSVIVSDLTADFSIQGYLEDVSTASSVYIPVSKAGYLRKVNAVLNADVSTADAVISVYHNTDFITSFTIPSTATAGYLISDFFVETRVEAGDLIRYETDGGSTGTASLSIDTMFMRHSFI